MDDEDLRAELFYVDGQEPSIHKLDKKMTIIIMNQCETLSILGKHAKNLEDNKAEIEAVKKEQEKNKNFMNGVAWVAGSIFTLLTGWLAIKK